MQRLLFLAIFLAAAVISASTAPRVIAIFPTEGVEVGLSAPVLVSFDQPMDAGSVENSISIQPEAILRFQWLDQQTLQILPEQEWQRATTYTVTISASAQSTADETLAFDYAFQFQTVGLLRVLAVTPEAGNELVIVDETQISIAFDRPVVPLVSSSDQADLPVPIEVDPPVRGTGRWLTTSLYIITSRNDLNSSTEYTITVPAGLTAIDGSVLEEDFVWQFRTLAPQVTGIHATAPFFNDRILLDSGFKIEFSQRMDRNAAESAFLLLLDGQPVHGRFRWRGSNHVMTFTPDDYLPPDSEVVVSLDTSARTQDGFGVLVAPIEYTFTTVGLPQVEDVSPSNRTVAPGYIEVRFAFNTLINNETIPDHYIIDPMPEGDVDVYFDNTDRNTFRLGFYGMNETTYTITLQTGIEDIYGNMMAEDFVHEITVRRPSENYSRSSYHYYTWSNVRYNFSIANRDDGNPVLSLYAYPDSVMRIYNAPFEQIPPFYMYIRPYSNERTLYHEYGRSNSEHYYHPPAYANEDNLLYEWIPEEISTEYGIGMELTLADGEPLPLGVYGIEIQEPNHTAKDGILLAVANVGLTIKRGPKDTIVWATDLTTAQPLEGLTVTAFQNGEYIELGVTDSDGIVTITEDVLTPSALTFIIAEGEDRFGAWYGGENERSFDRQGSYMYTDRPIYRPGETVYFRGVLRDNDDATFTPPQNVNNPVELTVQRYDYYDYYYKIYRTYGSTEEASPWYTGEVLLTEFGTFSGSFQIPDDVQLGNTVIVAELCSDADCTQSYQATISFEVAEFRVPEFEVIVTAQQDEIISGEPLQALVEGQYYFGAPLNNATLDWQAYGTRTYFHYQGDERGYRFLPYPGASSLRSSRVWEQTDDDGFFLIDRTFEIRDGHPYVMTVEASITDDNYQTISGRTTVLIHAANVYLGARMSPRFGLTSEPFDIEFLSVYPDSTPYPNRPVTLNITEIRWERVEQSVGVYRWERLEIDLGSFETTTGEDGKGTFLFEAPNPASYRIEASTMDDEGRMAYTSTYFYARANISRPGETGWDAYEYSHGCSYSPEYRRLRITMDEYSYVPGDTAQVLIPNPFDLPVQALITVERAGVMFYDTLVIEGDSIFYPLDITLDYVPNAYVAVTLITIPEEDTTYQGVVRGSIAFTVQPINRRLNVSLSASEDVTRPGDEVWFDVQITDWQGNPVQGEVGLALVDEAALALRPDNSSTIESAFYYRQSHTVDTFISNWALLTAMDNTIPGGDCGGGGGGGAISGEAIPVREDFEFTPLWAPHIITDENGQARISVEMPDNLTRWELDARAVTMTTEVGQAEINITSSLPLIVRPAAPRFFVVDDRMVVSAVVNNLTGEDQSVDVSLDATGLNSESPITQTVSIPHNGRARVSWIVTVEDVEGVDLTVIADAGDYADAAKPLLTNEDGLIPVYRFLVRDTVATSGTIDEASATVEAIGLPGRYSDVDGTLTVQLDASLADVTLSSLDYVQNYPHQCVEQTVSRFLPNVVTLTALMEFGLNDPELESNLTEALDFAIEKLKQDQNEDGGWGWFGGMSSNSYVTSYAVLGLLEAQNAGYPIDPDMIANGVDSLRSAVIENISFNTSEWQLNRQAFILYVLARANVDVRENLADLLEQRIQMSLAGRSYLLMAYHIVAPDDPAVASLADDLLSNASSTATGTQWRESYRDWWNWGSDTRTTSLVLSALVLTRPDHPLLPSAVRWLITARRGDHWPTTQETTWAVIALTDWIVSTGELNADYAYTVNLNSDQIGQGAMQSASDSAELAVSVRDMLLDTLNYLTITRTEGDGTLYYNTMLNLQLPADEVDAFSNGIVVDRRYYLNSNMRSLTDVTTAINDTITVRIVFTLTNDIYYFVLEDMLPAGLEVIDTNLLTETSMVSDPTVRRHFLWDPYWRWANWYFDRIELRDTGANIYAEFLPRGTYIFSYQARATSIGEFQTIPTQAYAFYQPELYGRSDGVVFTVMEAPEQE